MAKSTRAVAAFRVEAAMERRLASLRVKATLPRLPHWRTEAEYERSERKPLPRNSFNPFATVVR